MGYAIERQSDILAAPVTYLLWDAHNRMQDAQSPHICVPSNPLPLPCLQGTSANREGRKKAGEVLGMREEWHIFVLENWANVTLEFWRGDFTVLCSMVIFGSLKQ